MNHIWINMKFLNVVVFKSYSVLLQLCGLQRLHWSHQAWWQASLPTEPSHQLQFTWCLALFHFCCLFVCFLLRSHSIVQIGQELYVAQAGLELTLCLLQPLFWFIFATLGIKPRALCLLGKHCACTVEPPDRALRTLGKHCVCVAEPLCQPQKMTCFT